MSKGQSAGVIFLHPCRTVRQTLDTYYFSFQKKNAIAENSKSLIHLYALEEDEMMTAACMAVHS
jgi:hypothetical protein